MKVMAKVCEQRGKSLYGKSQQKFMKVTAKVCEQRGKVCQIIAAKVC